MRLKSLPSLKEKKRYVIFRIHSESPLNYPNVRDAILDSLANWLGQNEMAKAKIRIIKNLWDGREKIGFISCSNKFVESVKVGLALIHQIGDQRVIFQVVRVSGTIKSGKI